MRLLVDAQLPKRLAAWLTAQGHEALHTLDLPQGNRTPDAEICRIADTQDRILVTKDRDFLNSFYINHSPRKLLWVTVGNISNDRLISHMEDHLSRLEAAFEVSSCIELTLDGFTIHH